MGSEREVARAVPTGTGDDEWEPRLDAAAGLCIRRPAGGRFRLGPAAASAGTNKWQPAIVAAAGRAYRTADDRHRTCTAECGLCAELQPDGSVRRLAVPILSAGLSAAAGRLSGRHGTRDGACLRCRGRHHSRTVELGTTGLGQRLRQCECQSVQQHQCQSCRDLFEHVAGEPRWWTPGGDGAATWGTGRTTHTSRADCLRVRSGGSRSRCRAVQCDRRWRAIVSNSPAVQVDQTRRAAREAGQDLANLARVRAREPGRMPAGLRPIGRRREPSQA